MFLGKGQNVTLEELLLGLSICSGNDAAYALAYITCGSMETFVERMNQVAENLGLQNTHFVESSGYSENNTTTAKEMAAFCRIYIKNHPESIKRFHSVLDFTYPKKHNLADGDVIQAQDFSKGIPEHITMPVTQKNTGNHWIFIVNRKLWNDINTVLGVYLAQYRTQGTFMYSKSANKGQGGYVKVGATFDTYEYAGNEISFVCDRALTREYPDKGYEPAKRLIAMIPFKEVKNALFDYLESMFDDKGDLALVKQMMSDPTEFLKLAKQKAKSEAKLEAQAAKKGSLEERLKNGDKNQKDKKQDDEDVGLDVNPISAKALEKRSKKLEEELSASLGEQVKVEAFAILLLFVRLLIIMVGNFPI